MRERGVLQNCRWKSMLEGSQSLGWSAKQGRGMLPGGGQFKLRGVWRHTHRISALKRLRQEDCACETPSPNKSTANTDG